MATALPIQKAASAFLAVAATVANMANAYEVEITALARSGAVAPGDARVFARAAGHDPLDLGPLSSVRFELPESGRWSLQIIGSRLWSPPIEVEGPGRFPVEIFPGSAYVGSLQLKKKGPGSVLPKEVFVRTTACGERKYSNEVACPIGANGDLRCNLPSDCIDLRVRARGFVSHFFWDQRASAATGEKSLGTLLLVPGASVTGFVATEDGRPFDKTTKVSLKVQGMTVDGHSTSAKVDDTRLEATPDRRGFFQLSDAPPGDYELTAEQAGYSKQSITNVRVREGLETPLRDAIVLSKPKTASFQVIPSVSPNGAPWSARFTFLHPTGPQTPRTGEFDYSGFILFEDLNPGKYAFALLQAGRPIVRREVEVKEALEHFLIDVALVPVRGTVRIGGDELPEAKVVFGGFTGSKSVAFVTDSEGVFSGFLPHDGYWKVDIESKTFNVYRSLGKVLVRQAKKDSPAKVEVRLEDGSVEGVVVDENSMPAPKALVELRPEGDGEGFVGTLATEEGTFEIRGLPAGNATIRAEGRDGSESDATEVAVSEYSGTPLRLVLKPKKEITGRVLDQFGPVVAGNIFLREFGNPLDRGASTTTELDGSFRAKLPSDVREIHLFASSPSRTFYVGRQSLRSSPLDVVLSSDGGTLDLSYPVDKWEWVYLLHDGAAVWYGFAQQWASLQTSLGGLRDADNGRLVLPRLSPGDWSACLVQPGTKPWLQVALLGQSSASHCRDFLSSPGTPASADLKPLEQQGH